MRRAKQMGVAAAQAMILAALLCAVPPPAKAQTHPIDISATDLAGALSQLARLENVELLFDQSLVAGKAAPPLQNAASLDLALKQLLAGSGLSWRQTDTGTIVIFAEPAPAKAAANQPAMAIEEILVIGRRTQNTDIRRSEDDIQPYQIADSATIADSQATSLDDFFRNRLSSNTQALALNQDPAGNNGATRSQVNLRGLGTDQTLILVDGRRLPSIPFLTAFSQPDVNGLSPGMIDRIEVLGASAGGIFGIGAAGGAVNVVLKRDFESRQLAMNNGLSAQGDAWHWRLDGTFGFSISDTGTHVMIHAGHSQDRGLTFGDRDFVVDARAVRAQRLPAIRETVASPSINFNSVNGDNLTLVPSLGGGSLNATTTFLPIDAPPVAAGGAALLKANAGGYDISLSPDAQGTHQSLVSPMSTTSVLMTVRQELDSWLEAYLDLLYLQNDGHATTPAIDTRFNTFSGGSPGNPFNQTVTVSFPVPGLSGNTRTQTLTDRVSAGVIVRLGGGWSATLDAATGQARLSSAVNAVDPSFPRINAILGLPALTAQLAPLSVSPFQQSRIANRLNDFNLRIGGPLLELAGGPLSLTATGEFFQEFNSGTTGTTFNPTVTTRGDHSRRDVGSIFFEARAPLVAADSDLTLLRGLELQVAVRGDHYVLTAPGGQVLGAINPPPIIPATVSRGTVIAETAGARVMPVDGLTLRASVSTGLTPPTSTQIIDLGFVIPYTIGVVDPKRGGPQPRNFSDQFDLSLAGKPSLRPAKTTTTSVGAIVRPAAIPGLRVSLDYSRLQTNGEITTFAQGDYQYFIDHEATYPGRVTRAPLSAADAALGYTGGKITAIDASYLQTGRSVIQTMDFNLDYLRPTSIGTFHVYGRATLEDGFRRSGDPDKPSYDLVDHADGPLGWRANGGLGWSQDGWSTALNFSVFGAQSGYSAAPPTTALLLFLSGGQPIDPTGTNAAYIPAQVYFDWLVGLQSTLQWIGSEATHVEYRFGIRNLLDSQPPAVAGTFALAQRNFGFSGYDYNPLGGYSPFGDPFGRRFEFNISASF